MNNYTHTYFLDGKLHVRGSASAAMPSVFYVEPDGQHRGASMNFHIHAALPLAEQAEIAERLAQGVTEWADSIRAHADAERTAADELAEARAEIARLQGESEDA
ncbi:hypothetical protein [Streptomyces sp. NRRL F-5630]|uniref:hypothetical protein n=1 Tax=Streptomyces sp. NRRL F-5630 TaxID=1463864 RepID=UPI003D751731